MSRPWWTVHYNILSKENGKWVGTGWEFFDEEADAEACHRRHTLNGDCGGKRPFHPDDFQHLGARHHPPMSLHTEGIGMVDGEVAHFKVPNLTDDDVSEKKETDKDENA